MKNPEIVVLAFWAFLDQTLSTPRYFIRWLPHFQKLANAILRLQSALYLPECLAFVSYTPDQRIPDTVIHADVLHVAHSYHHHTTHTTMAPEQLTQGVEDNTAFMGFCVLQLPSPGTCPALAPCLDSEASWCPHPEWCTNSVKSTAALTSTSWRMSLGRRGPCS